MYTNGEIILTLEIGMRLLQKQEKAMLFGELGEEPGVTTVHIML